MRLAFLGGWNGAKLYFMLGLPTETAADVAGIAALVRRFLKETPLPAVVDADGLNALAGHPEVFARRRDRARRRRSGSRPTTRPPPPRPAAMMALSCGQTEPL